MPDCLPPASRPDDRFPLWAEEPPVPPEGSLVPGSRFHEEQWVMAAGMLARGASFQQVARAMGCSRTTLWRAYYGSQAFRHRVWWERQALNRESDLRLASLRALVTEQVERLVSAVDPSTVRWLAERLGLFKDFDSQPGMERRESAPAAAPSGKSPDLPPADPQPAPPAASAGLADAAGPFDDDSVPGALRERTPPDPKAVAAILARPEAEGQKGVYPWTYNPDDPFPNLGSALERQGGQGAFTRRR
ncbi:hypothetical protein HUE56_18585 [Azospirillum oryzae]|uniref:Homeodomain-like domain-containing protein n=1 Tax=Azospirillum oryzae TaxID=286727 RepID=A0A6N1AKN1_9PROT|nr:hypothetical protein [Azospirillum oryzae]KAA0591107.1 hypothetical protein FZ938_03165 [Azospirillum oryzae]QKS52395.1 hypothetical protein HUE56_18585 [Azospirillum oryzae]GLR78036.1 hypothetical protein GCM10007856_07060 [Azospirillum oryzae]